MRDWTSTANRIGNRDRWACRYCGEGLTRETITMDHVLPKSKGGRRSDSNLAAACRKCNNLKANLTAGEFLSRCEQRRSEHQTELGYFCRLVERLTMFLQ